MTPGFWIGLIVAIVAVLTGAYVLLEFVIGPRERALETARLAELITPLSSASYRYATHDDTLRLNAEQRREKVEAKRREAAQIASGHPMRPKAPAVVRPVKDRAQLRVAGGRR